jgi:preprotein translocase subunit SecB
MNLNFKLAYTRVSKLTFETYEGNEEHLGFKYDLGMDENSKRLVRLVFDLNAKHQRNEIAYEVVFEGFFEFEEPLPDDFLASETALINLPAIVYPMLRSFVATFLLSAGHDPFYLPIVNFEQLVEENKQRQKQESSESTS